MATQYDPDVIQKLADKLYSQAQSTLFICTLVGLLILGGAGFSVGADLPSAGAIAPLIGAAVGGLVGFFVGRSRAFLLRAQAQTILCQRQIEFNTRR